MYMKYQPWWCLRISVSLIQDLYQSNIIEKIPLKLREKERDFLSPMTKAPYQQKIQQPIDNTKYANKNFDYTTIVNRLRTVSWSNYSHPTGVIKPVYGYPTFH